MPAPANLVHEASSSTGVGDFTLTAVNGKQRFSTAFGTGVSLNVFDYFISNRDAAEYERGTGHMSATGTLVRDTVTESTNANAAVNFSAGVKDVVCDIPAGNQARLDAAQTWSGLNTFTSEIVTVTSATTTQYPQWRALTASGQTVSFGAGNSGTAQAERAFVYMSSYSGGFVATWDQTTALMKAAAGITPMTNDVGALGSASVSWADLFLASGALINFANGDLTLTHSTGTLTANGVIAATGFSPTATTATGNRLYLPAANTLGFSINGTGEVQLTASALSPITNDGNALGTTSLMWSDLFLASGGVINFNAGDVTLTHSADTLTLAGGDLSAPSNFIALGDSYLSSALKVGTFGHLIGRDSGDGSMLVGGGQAQVRFVNTIAPTTNDAVALGTSSLMWSDLFLASGGVINFNASNVTITHSAGLLTLAGSLTVNGTFKQLNGWAQVGNYNGGGTNYPTIDYGLGIATNWTGGERDIAFINTNVFPPTTSFYWGQQTGASAITELLRLYTNGQLVPGANDGGALGNTARAWSDLFLASGAVINFANGGVTITHNAGDYIAFEGASAGYLFDSTLRLITNDTGALGTTSQMWSDLFLASGAVINFNAGDVTVTHAANTLTFAGATSGYIFNDGVVSMASDSVVRQGASGAGLWYNGNVTAGRAFLGMDLGSDSVFRLYGAAAAANIISVDLAAATTAFGGNVRPATNDGAALGTTSLGWSDLHLAAGGIINWANGDVAIVNSTNALTFSGASSGYLFDGFVAPSVSDSSVLGSSTLMWSDLFLASGAVINFNNGDVTITHVANTLNFAGASSGYGFDAVIAGTSMSLSGSIELGHASDTTLARSAAGTVTVEGKQVLLNSQTATISAGWNLTPYNGGTVSSGTYTPDPANGNYQYYTNNGAHVLANPGSDCAIDILVTNGASAGAITFTTFTATSPSGDALTLTNTSKFIISIRRINAISTYVIKALQ